MCILSATIDWWYCQSMDVVEPNRWQTASIDGHCRPQEILRDAYRWSLPAAIGFGSASNNLLWTVMVHVGHNRVPIFRNWELRFRWKGDFIFWTETGTVSYRKYRNTVSVSGYRYREKTGDDIGIIPTPKYRYRNTDNILVFTISPVLKAVNDISKHLQPNGASQRVTNHNLSVVWWVPKNTIFSVFVTPTFDRGKTNTASISFGRFSRLLRGPWPVATILYRRKS